MQIKEVTPPVERTFTIDLTERELKILKAGFGLSTKSERQDAGSPETRVDGEGFDLYQALAQALA